MKLSYTNFGHLARLTRQMVVVGVCALLVSTMTTPAAQAATVGSAPQVNLAQVGETEVQINWEAPAYTVTTADGVNHGPSGWKITVHNPGSLSTIFTSNSCSNLAANANECVFIAPTGKTAFDVRVKALYNYGAIADISPAGIGSINFANLVDFENVLTQASGSDTAEVSWTNVSNAALDGAQAKIFVEGVFNSLVTAADGVAPEAASLIGISAGNHSMILQMLNSSDVVIAEYSFSYNHPVVPSAPTVSADFSSAPNGSNLVNVTWTTNPADASTISGWDVTVTTDGEVLPDGCNAVTANTRSCVLTAVDPNSRYEIAVSAIYGAGAFGDSGFALLGITPITALNVEPSSATGATLTWVVDDIVAARVDHSVITLDGQSLDCPDADTFNECVISDLVIGQTYGASVTLIGLAGQTVSQDQISFVFNGIPAAPVVSISEPNSSGVATVSWAYPDGLTPTGVNGWDIFVYLAGTDQLAGTCDVAQLPASTMSCTIEGVLDTTGILVELRPLYGQNLLGEVAYGSLHITPIIDLVGTINAANEADISWSVDPLVDAIADSATVTVDGQTVACPDALTLNTCVVADLTLDSTHTVVVTLFDFDGNVIVTESSDFTLGTTPDAPTVSVIVAGSTATVSWTYPSGAPAGITGFDVIAAAGSMSDLTGTCANEFFSASATSCTITDISDADTYEIAVRPIYGTNLLGAAGYVYINVTPVSDFEITATSDSEVAVGWTLDPFYDARADSIVFKVDGVTVECINGLLASECLADSLVVGQTYEVELQLVDVDGNIFYATFGSFTFQDLPVAPVVTVSTENEFGVSTVTWSYSGDLVADGITGWDVFVTLEDGTDALGTCAASVFSLGRSSCTITGVSLTNAAAVEVSAAYGRSLQGRVGYGYVHVEPVSTLVALTSDSGQMTVQWSLDQLVDVRFDSVVVSVDGAAQTCADAATSFECVISGLQPNSSYSFEVTLFDASGVVIGSDSVIAEVMSTVAAPTLTVQDNGTSAVASWSYPAGAPAGITGWDVVVTNDGLVDATGTCAAGQLSANATSCVLSDLDLTVGYQVQVSPIFGIAMLGESAYGYVRVQPLDSVTIAGVDVDSASLSWTISSLVEPRVASMSLTLNGTPILCADALLHGECLINGLLADQSYTFELSALDGSGAVVDSVTQEFVFTAAPAAPNAQIVVNGSVATVSWSYPNDILPIGINGWDVLVTTADGSEILGTCSEVTFTVETRSCTITGIDPTVAAVIEVRAIYDIGLFTQPDYVYLNLDPITELSGLTSAVDELTVSWIVDPLVDSQIDTINVYVDDVLTTCVDAIVLSHCHLTDLNPGQTYEVRIELIDALGVLIAFETQNLTVLTAPSAPSVEIVVNGTDATVSWSYPTGNPAGINGWFVTVSTSGQTDPTGTCMVGPFDLATTSCQLTDLDLLSSYEIVVQPLYGLNLTGNSAFAYIRVTPVGDFIIEADSSSSATLVWTVDGLFEPRVDSITVALDGIEQNCSNAMTLSECGFTGLVKGQQYTSTVSLKDFDSVVIAASDFTFTFGGLPVAPTVTVEDTDLNGTASVNWSYPDGILPTGVTGFDVVAFLEDGSEIVGTCADATFNASTLTCSIAGVSPTNALAVEVRPIHGRGVLGAAGYAYLYVTEVSNAQVLTSSASGQVTITWAVHTLVESRISDITVFVDGIAATCTDSAATNSCVIDGLTPNQSYSFRVGLRDAEDVIFADTYITSGPISAPSAPNVDVTDDGTSAMVVWSNGQTPDGVVGWMVDVVSTGADIPVDSCLQNQLDASTTSCMISGLELTNGYEFAVTPIYGTNLSGTTGYGYLRVNPISDVAAVPTADTQARISWSIADLVIDRVDHVAVYVDGTEITCPDSLLANSCLIELLIPGITYSLNVQLHDVNSAIVAQQTIEYTHHLPTVAATNFEMSPVVDGVGTLTWSFDPALTGLISGWDIQIQSNVATTDLIVSCDPGNGVIPAATRSCVISGLDPDAMYLFELRTVLGVDVYGSPAFTAVNSSTAEGFLGLATSHTSANFAWSAGLGWDNLIHGYAVSINGVLTCTLSTSQDLLAPNCDATDLTPGVEVSITIDALDSVGAVINTVTTSWLQPVLPVATDITSSVSGNEVTVNWNYDSLSSTANIIGWSVLVEDRYGDVVAGTCDSSVLAAARSCVAIVDDASLGNRFTVSAIYDESVISTPVVAYRGPVSEVTEAAIYPESNTVQSALINFAGIDTVTDYIVEATDVSGALEMSVADLGDNTWRISGVTPGEQYLAYIRPVVDGVSAFDAVVTAPYTGVNVPTPSLSVSANMTGTPRQIAVSFDAATPNGVAVLNYTVTATTPDRDPVSITGRETQVVFNGLPAGLTYEISVVANSFVGSSAPATTTITTTNVPLAPSIQSVQLVTATSVRVTWDAPVAAAGRADVDGYYINVSPAAGVTKVQTGASVTSAVVTGLTQGVNYYFTVRATSLAGDSISSTNQVITTPSLVSAVAARATADAITVTWRAAKGAITSHVVRLTDPNNNVTTNSVAADALTTTFNSLTPGVTYGVTIESFAGAVSAGTTTSFPVAIDNVPLAPTSAALSLYAADSMRVTWVAPTATAGRAAVTGYKIHAVPSDGVSLPITITSVERSAIISDLTPGVAYAVSISAESNVGESAQSVASSAVYTPSVATDVSAVMTTPTAVNVSWVAPLGDVTGYTVTATGTNGKVSRASVSSSSSNVNFIGLTQGVTYSISVLSQYGRFNAGESVPAEIYITDIPNAPVVNSVALETATSAIVDWTAPVTATNRSTVTGYVIIATPSAGVLTPVLIADATSGIVENLAVGVTYTFTVKAQSVAGLSLASNAVTITTPSAPVIVTARASGPEVSVTWRAARGAVTDYEISLTDESGNTETYLSTGTGLTKVIGNLLTAETYSVSVNALYGTIKSPVSAPVAFTVSDVPNAPTTVVGTMTSATSARVTWTAPLAVAGRAAVTGYTVSISPSEGRVIDPIVGSSLRSVIVEGLTPGVVYSFTVTAKSLVGDSAESVAGVLARTPSVATNVEVSANTATSVNVVWTAPLGDVTGYAITATPAAGNVIRISAAADATTAVVSGLALNTAYTFAVTANFGRFTAGPSDEVAQHMDGAPFAPTALNAELLTTSSAQLTWTAPVASDDRAAPSEYVVTASPSVGLELPTISGDATSAVVSGLVAGTSYTFSIKALSTSGASVLSERTTLIAPQLPTTVVVRATGTDAVVTWRAPRGVVTSYDIEAVEAGGSVVSASVVAPTLTTTLSDLIAGGSYSITVSANYGAVNSGKSLPTEFSIADVPNAPTAPVFSLLTDTTARVAWTGSIAEAGKQVPNGYVVSVTPSDGVTIPSDLLSSARSATITGLTPGVEYQFAVRATSLVGKSPWSVLSDGVVAPQIATNVEISTGLLPTANVTWSAAPGAVTSYVVTATPTVGRIAKATVLGDQLSATLTSLLYATDYSVTVTAMYGRITAGPSVAATFTSALAPVLPANFTAPTAEVTADSITVTYQELTPTAPVTVLGYYILIDGVEAPGCGSPTELLAIPTCTMTGGVVGTNYRFLAKAVLAGYRATEYTMSTTSTAVKQTA